MKRRIISLETLPDFDHTEGRYFTWLTVTTAYPHIEEVKGMFVATLKDPKKIAVRVKASKEDGIYTIEGIVESLNELINELRKYSF